MGDMFGAAYAWLLLKGAELLAWLAPKLVPMQAWAVRMDQRYAIGHWLVQVFIAFDQLANVLLGPFSRHTWADETLSARCGRLGYRYPYKVWKVLIDWMFFWQGPNHCLRAHEKEKTRYHSPPAQR